MPPCQSLREDWYPPEVQQRRRGRARTWIHSCVSLMLALSLRQAGRSFLTPCSCLPSPSSTWEGPEPPQLSHLAGSSSPICLLLSCPRESRARHLWSLLLRQPPTRLTSLLLFSPPCTQGSGPKPKFLLASTLSRSEDQTPMPGSRVINEFILVYLASHDTLSTFQRNPCLFFLE